VRIEKKRTLTGCVSKRFINGGGPIDPTSSQYRSLIRISVLKKEDNL
jgi:hypothetical protein